MPNHSIHRQHCMPTSSKNFQENIVLPKCQNKAQETDQKAINVYEHSNI
jgi:hypothetical protein